MSRLACALLAAALVITTMFASSARAQVPGQVSVKAELLASNLYVGDPVLLRLTVDGSKSPDEPELKAVPGCDIEFIGGGNSSQTSVIIINGRRQDNSSESYTFQYKVTPTKAGRLRIPQISVTVDGKVYKTNPIEMDVQEPKAAEGFRLVLEPEKKSVYVGEPIRLHVVWYLGSTVQKVTFSLPESDAYELMTPESSKPATAMQRNNRAVEVPFVSGTVAGTLAERELEGKTYTSLSIEQILVPTKPGKVTVGPLRVTCSVATGKRQARFTDSPFDDLTIYERRVVDSEPLELEVKPLPTPAPASFSGLVGKYSIDATASPTVLNVGDPFTLMVRVAGPEPLDRVPPLELERKPAFIKAFKMPTETAIPAITPTAAIFSITMRPRSDAVKEVPAVELSYFDPTIGEYAIASSKTLSLKVQPTKEVTLDDAPDQVTEPTTISEAEQKRADGPPALRNDGDPFNVTPFGVSTWVRTPSVLAAASVPVLWCGIIAAVSARRKRHERDPEARRRRRALRSAQNRLARAARRNTMMSHVVPAAVSDAIRRYAADMTGVSETSLTSQECRAYFDRVDPKIGERLADILRRCDESQYAGVEHKAASASQLASDARVLLWDLARSGRLA